MPRVNRVKHARALYYTKPDIDPETGEQKTALVFQRDGVTPKTDKRGKQIVRRLTVRDLDRPKPNLRCDFPGCADPEIRPGQSYKFLALRFGQKNRHAEHPDWQHWEYSSSVAAQCARLQADMHTEIDDFEFTAEEDFDNLRESLQSQAQDFLSEREESLENMPEQLQDGSQAQEYVDLAQEWVDSFDQITEPSAEFAEKCEACDGTGEGDPEEEFYAVFPDGREDGPFATEGDALNAIEEDPEVWDEEDEDPYVDSREGDAQECPDCDGGFTEDASEDWVEEARQALHDAVDEAQF